MATHLKKRPPVSILLLTAAAVLGGGCSTVVNSHTRKAAMMGNYLAGDFATAQQQISEKLKSTAGTGDELMWRLEAGSALFNCGRYDESVAEFEKAEALIRDYDTRAIISLRDTGAEGAMAVTNLNALPYRGFARDRIMIPVFKALAYLGRGDEEGFQVELRRLRAAQDKVIADNRTYFEAEDKALRKAQAENRIPDDGKTAIRSNEEFARELAKVRQAAQNGYGNYLNPAAIFLSGIGFLRDGDPENALIDFERLHRAMTGNSQVERLYVTLLRQTGREIPPELSKVAPFDFPLDRDVVYLFFANGRSAAFRQVAVWFPVMTAWPVCEYYDAPYRRVTAGDATAEKLADFDGILSQEYDERLAAMIARITISTLIKEGGSYAASYAVYRENELAGLLVFLGSMFYRAAFNTADTRSWEILPKELLLAILPMPATHELGVTAAGPAGTRKALIRFSSRCRSAIVYINAPSAGVFQPHVLEMNSK